MDLYGFLTVIPDQIGFPTVIPDQIGFLTVIPDQIGDLLFHDIDIFARGCKMILLSGEFF